MRRQYVFNLMPSPNAE